VEGGSHKVTLLFVSIDLNPARLDRTRPFVDLARNERAEILGGAALGWDQIAADLFQPLPYERHSHRGDRGMVELLDDRSRCALGKKVA
jgi:hypothetical protein